MTIKLWDRLLKLPETRDPHVERARQDLKLPKPNHALVTVGDEPLAERFVFPEGVFDELKLLFCDEESRALALKIARVPCYPCWIETQWIAWHFWRDEAGIGRVCVLINGSIPFAVIDVDKFLNSDKEQKGITLAGEAWAQMNAVSIEDQRRLMGAVFFLLASISLPRLTSIRQRLSGEAVSAADRALRRRRAYVGRPVFSFNEVTLVPAKTALHRGVLKPIESFAGMRGHVVMGHWRLIDGKVEAYWIWVDGHRRGDDRLGTIVKQRNVGRSRERFRRGFSVPDGIGAPGEKRAARRFS